jgi:hypothetical protein
MFDGSRLIHGLRALTQAAPAHRARLATGISQEPIEIQMETILP